MISRPIFTMLVMLVHVLILSACAVNTSQPNNNLASSVSLAEYREGKVLVVNSNLSIDRYQIAQKVFIDSILNTNLTLVNLEHEAQPVEYLQDVLNKNNYDAIYCIGAKALGSIEYISPDAPVVYSAVLNWRRFKDHKNYFGISSELSPEVQLTWIKYFFKDIQKIGVYYSQENESLISDAVAVSKNLSINLIPIKLNTDEHLLASAKEVLPKFDALWLISDSSVLSSANSVEDLFNLAKEKNVPVLAYNTLFIDMGAVMSLGIDLPTTARQAAILTSKILDKQMPKEVIQFPAGSKIVLNRKGLNHHQMKLNPGVLDSVDELR